MSCVEVAVDMSDTCTSFIHTVNPRISPLGAYLFFGFLPGGFFEEGA